MDSDQLREYKREKSRLFNAKMRDLRLKDKENKKIADQQGNTIDKQDDQQPDDKQDELSLQDLLDIFSTLDTKMDIIQTKLETIIETKLETKLETNQPQPNSIFFA